jgi:hypothetical protein
MYFDYDPNDAVAGSFNAAMTMKDSVVGPVWSDLRLRVDPSRVLPKRLYTRTRTAADLRLTDFGKLVFFTAGGIASPVGQLLINFRFRMYTPQSLSQPNSVTSGNLKLRNATDQAVADATETRLQPSVVLNSDAGLQVEGAGVDGVIKLNAPSVAEIFANINVESDTAEDTEFQAFLKFSKNLADLTATISPAPVFDNQRTYIRNTTVVGERQTLTASWLVDTTVGGLLIGSRDPTYLAVYLVATGASGSASYVISQSSSIAAQITT